MKSSTKRFVSILLSLLILIASIFVYSTLIRPAYSEIEKLRAQAGGKTQLLEQQQSSTKQIQSLLSQYQDVLKVEDTISSILPLSPSVASGINQITGLSKINNLAIDLLSIEETAIKPSEQSSLVRGVGALKFNFHLIGSYENFKAFLQNLETNITLMDLTNLKMEPAVRTKTGENRFSYTLNVNTYYQAE